MAKILSLQSMQQSEEGGLTVSFCSIDCSANPECGRGGANPYEQFDSTCSIGCI